MDRAGDVSQSPVSVALTGAYDIDRGAPWDGMAAIRINRGHPAEYRTIGSELPTGAVIETPPGEIALSCRHEPVERIMLRWVATGRRI